jgi:hypothetical protein
MAFNQACHGCVDEVEQRSGRHHITGSGIAVRQIRHQVAHCCDTRFDPLCEHRLTHPLILSEGYNKKRTHVRQTKNISKFFGRHVGPTESPAFGPMNSLAVVRLALRVNGAVNHRQLVDGGGRGRVHDS